ncbi:MAG TPA: VWA domain-containing protein [Thermoanaerobaculia bacterium]|nr:VWA domain-containing protein [Thermoanaerobaculia bacterium]
MRSTPHQLLQSLAAAGMAGLLFSCCVSAPVAAQEEPPAATYQGSAEVEVVEVPVQVVRDGKPVRGLQQADFTVFAGKQKQPLLGFEVVDLSMLDATSATPTGPAGVDLPAAGRRHFLFLFDLSSADPHALGRAQDAALEVVRTALTPTDFGAVAVYSPARGARVLLAFTSDREQLELALTTLGSSELVEHRSDWLGLSLGFAREKLRMVEQHGAGPPTGSGGEGGSGAGSAREIALQEMVRTLVDLQGEEERGQAANTERRAQSFTRSLQDLAELMQRLDGRKYVVLLSEGFDSRVLLGDQRQAERSLETSDDDQRAILRIDSERRFGSSKLQSSFRHAIEEMRRADCVVHAIDIGRITSGGRDVAADLVETTGAPGQQAPQPVRGGEETLFALANGTGGALYRNFNDVGAAMRKVLDVSSVTYLLTIPAPHATDETGFVSLRVEVRGAKPSEVSARGGFYANPTPLQQLAAAERLRIGAQVLEGRAGGAVHTAMVGVPLADGSGACAVVEVDGASLLEGHVGDMVSAEVMVYAFDQAGAIRAVARQLVGMDLNVVGTKLRGTGFKLFANLDLPAGEYQLRTLVRNTVSTRYGIAVAPLVVPGAKAGASLAGVFVEPPGRDWLLVRDTGAGQPLAYPFTLGERVVVPAAAPTLRAGETATLWIEAPAGSSLEGVVKRGDGAVAASAPLRLGERTPEAAAERLLATFSPTGLPPGGYTLEVRAPGTATPASSLSFSVE